MPGEIQKLVADLKRVPIELRRELRPAVRAAAQRVLDDAKDRASWSSRIPGAMRISVRFSGRMAGASVVVSAAKAPHGRPYEHLGDPGSFRHPVFGHRDRWVSQQARPFLFPAARANRDRVAEEIDHAVEQSLLRTGWR
ncbi:HK97 gp10 family phage protein [Microtetraspora malaysiensis]|uniref:HK97 gp10 family phage protein n=1 Tax=Microtetraspora malaysiensis TaxID=161358 RepID=UPI003D8BF910